jgi:hypothetical protein
MKIVIKEFIEDMRNESSYTRIILENTLSSKQPSFYALVILRAAEKGKGGHTDYTGQQLFWCRGIWS